MNERSGYIKRVRAFTKALMSEINEKNRKTLIIIASDVSPDDNGTILTNVSLLGDKLSNVQAMAHFIKDNRALIEAAMLYMKTFDE